MKRTRSPFARAARSPGYQINAAADGEAEVMLFDEIGFWGIQAKPFIQELQALDVERIHVRINSPGGSVFDGIAIANALRQLDATVITHVDALAASIASVIALAGDEVHMADNAFLMIHDAWTISIGNATQLRADAALLDKIGGSIIDAYVKKTGASVDQVTKWMKAETWFSAQEAKDEGFIDAIEGQSDAEASFDLSVFNHAPAALVRREESEPGARELERALRDAGCSRAAAKAILAGGLKATATPREAEDAGVLEAGLALLAAFQS
jgi:ATP-dependent Clp protease protease subunit